MKELPRIPISKNKVTFLDFSKKGEMLVDLHVNFEQQKKWDLGISQGNLDLLGVDDDTDCYRVQQMKFAKKGDKSVVIYNKNITIENIPLEAYEYVVNGKPALEWVMERQCVKTDKASGIVNDAND